MCCGCASRASRTIRIKRSDRFSAGQILVTHRPRRILAMRLRDPERGIRHHRRTRPGGFQRGNRRVAPFLRDRLGRIQGLGRHQAALRRGGSLAAMVAQRASVHRRLGARHVSRSAEWESISRFRTRSRPRIFSPGRLQRAPSADERLRDVQHRREFPTRVTQGFQVFAHKRFIGPAMRNARPLTQLPLPLKLLQMFPILRRIPARLVGLGVRPEHVHTPDMKRQPSRQS